MFAKIVQVQQESNNKIVVLDGNFNGVISVNEKPTFFLQERITSDDFFIPERINIESKWQQDVFQLLIDMNQLTESAYFSKVAIWDFYISLGNKLEKIKMDITPQLTKHSINSSFQMNLYKTKMNTIAISVNQKEVSIIDWQGEVNGKQLDIQFNLNNHLPLENHEMKLKFKKRIQSDILYYQDNVEFPVQVNNTNEYISEIDLEKLVSKEYLYKKETWDVFLTIKTDGEEVEREYEATLSGSFDLLRRYKLLDYLEFNFYRNYKKAISLTISTSESLFNLENLQVNDDSILVIEGILKKGISLDNVVLVKESSFEEGQHVVNVVDLPFNTIGELLIINFSYKEVFNSIFTGENDCYSIYLEGYDKCIETKVRIPLISEGKGISIDSLQVNNETYLLLTKEGKLVFTSKKRTIHASDNNLKIAVLGSCFSRLAFSSSNFYNPNYKSRYNVVYTQFHSSIISLMSNPVEFPEEKFEGFDEREVGYVRSDYRKDFFAQVEKTQPDYLLLDFYVDGAKDILLFDDEHVITINYMLRRNINYLYELKDNVKVLTHNERDIKLYMELWEERIKEFAEKITKFIPEERIILKKVRKTEHFRDENGKLEKFNDNKYIKRSNYLFEYMENYFLQLLPKAKIIDLSNEKYYSLYNHPENSTPDHLESKYYQEMLSRLDEITLEHMLNKPKVAAIY